VVHSSKFISFQTEAGHQKRDIEIQVIVNVNEAELMLAQTVRIKWDKSEKSEKARPL
jgi:hypothetical protein